MKTSDINIRDPFVLCEGGKYYLYGTRGPTCWGPANGFDVYVSDDLEEWTGPHECFYNDGTFWADRNYWAPEVHVWQGKYYMFASFKNPDVHRGTAILCADSPMGPFRPHSEGCVTPREWECLDGTFYVSRAGEPYMVFCHEWVQVGDGEVCAVRLSTDLKRAEGEPRVLFHASDASWCQEKHHSSGVSGYVTDGPFLWRTGDGHLLCLWASFSEGGYTEGLAVSDNGEIDGHFSQIEPLFMEDGGHGMVFRDRRGQIMMTLHSPNDHLKERPVFYPLREENGRLCPAEEVPEWYRRLKEETDTLPFRIAEKLRPWQGSDAVITPEDCGYAGGLATDAIQEAIDRAAGCRGTVLLKKGSYVSGTLVLKSNVCLRIEEGAYLTASPDLKDFPEHHAQRLTVQDTSMGMHQSLIFAENCENICLCGGGCIDGRGTQDRFPGAETAQGTPGRPFVIRMIDSRDITVRDLTLRDSPCWMQNYLNCDRLLIENIRVYNHANYNNDGVDIDGCRDVILRGCVIRSGDDACCFKGASQRPTERVLVDDCDLYSAWNALKIGTDTQGDFRYILARDLRIGGLEKDPSGLKHPYSDSGISVEMMDGGTVEDILMTGIRIDRAWSPLFMRLEDRGRVKPGDARPGPGTIRRIVIEDVTGDDCGPRGSYMIGIPEKPIGEVLLKDIDIRQKPSCRPLLREEDIGEMRGVYPDAHMIDELGDAPAYALWARHVHGLRLIRYRVRADGGEKREAFVLKTDVE